jgi:HTH-type transcriptional regulator/antitoxin HigA
VRVAAELASRERMTKAQADYLESLTNNIMAYENKKMITKKTNPIEILRFLLEENGLTGSDLGRLLGQRQLGAKILKGSRKLNLNHIRKIAAYFSVSPELFV